MTAQHIGAVLLAAGASSRLGRPKQLLEFDGETLVRRAARAAVDAGIQPLVVVVAHDAHEQIHDALRGMDLEIHSHADWRSGMGSSLRAGVARAVSLHSKLDALAVLVSDQPFVTAAILRELASRFSDSPFPCAACSYGGALGVPAIFHRSLFPALLALPDEHGARRLIASLLPRISSLPFPRGEVDIDTEADCEELRHACGVKMSL